VHRKNILIYFQQNATLHSLFYLKTALHVSGGTATHHQERKQLYLQHPVFVTPLLLPAAIAAGSSNGVTNTRCYRYSSLRSWWWVAVPPETCRTVSSWNKLRNVTSCWMYIRELFKRCKYVISLPKYNIKKPTAKQAIKPNKHNPNIYFTQHKSFL
jgi:hypothetical protein